MTTVYGTPVDFYIKKSIKTEQPKMFGLSFPIGKNPKSNGGYFGKSSDLELVKSSLRQLLSTFPGERVMLPNYGLDLRQYLFEPLDATLFGEIKDKIITSINKYLPQVEIIKLQIISLDEIGYSGIPGLKITLHFKLKNYQNQLSDITIKVGA